MSDEINKLDISDEMIAERRGNQNKMPDDMPKLMANIILKICLLYTSDAADE